jgi:hypothetical protein
MPQQGKNILVSLPEHHAMTQLFLCTQILSLQQKNQCALELRGPGMQAPRYLSLSTPLW